MRKKSEFTTVERVSVAGAVYCPKVIKSSKNNRTNCLTNLKTNKYVRKKPVLRQNAKVKKQIVSDY
jgi:hypothetical protein